MSNSTPKTPPPNPYQRLTLTGFETLSGLNDNSNNHVQIHLKTPPPNPYQRLTLTGLNDNSNNHVQIHS